jgi:hypothetical protein
LISIFSICIRLSQFTRLVTSQTNTLAAFDASGLGNVAQSVNVGIEAIRNREEIGFLMFDNRSTVVGLCRARSEQTFFAQETGLESLRNAVVHTLSWSVQYRGGRVAVAHCLQISW